MLRASSNDPTTYTLSSVAGKGRKGGEEREGRRKERGGGKGVGKEREGRRKGRGREDQPFNRLID